MQRSQRRLGLTLAPGIIAFLLNPARLAVQAEGSNNITTAPIPESGRLPGFATDSGVIFGFLVVTILVGVGYWVLLNRTVFGRYVRAIGDNTVAGAWRPPFLIIGAAGVAWVIAWFAVRYWLV